MARLREYLRSLSPGLADVADNLWRLAIPIHVRQNKTDSLTENGIQHVEEVEKNIWRLLTHDGRYTAAFTRLFNNHPFPLFVLSGAACCHDFDKALDLPPSFKHGQGSADFIQKNQQILGLTRVQRQAIQKAIRIHDIKDKHLFLQALEELQTKEAGPQCEFNLRLIAVLLKAADILHADNSRILNIEIVSPERIVGLDRLKYLSRNAVKGWFPDGSRVVFQAEPESSDEKAAVNSSFDYMRSQEWSCVRMTLESTELPFELALQVEPAPITLSTGSPALSGHSGQGDAYGRSLDACSLPPARSIPEHSHVAQTRDEPRDTSRTQYTVGVGLQPSRDDDIYHLGHMWIRWPNPFTGELSHRGYWPVLDDLPIGLSNHDMRNYLCKNAVRGMYKIDTAGRNIENANIDHRRQHWEFSERAFYRLAMIHCNLPDGVGFRLTGKYSCSENIDDTDNCSSWAITALRAAMENPNFINCQRIKRLRFVEKAIWGSNEYSPQEDADVSR